MVINIKADINIITPTDDDYVPCLTASPSLSLLAYVDPNRIPLHLICGPSCYIESTHPESALWLKQTFSAGFPESSTLASGYGTSTAPPDVIFPVQSSIGLLLKVDRVYGSAPTSIENARITELLVYATISPVGHDLSVSPTYQRASTSATKLVSNLTVTTFLALPLSSDLVYQPSISQAPTSVPDTLAETEPLNTSFSGKDRLSTLFDEASDRRKKARRKGGQSISVAASRGAAAPRLSLPAVKIEEEEDAASVTTPVVESSRPASRRSLNGNSIAPVQQRSIRPTVGHAEQVTTPDTDAFMDTTFEARNKTAISRMVMAGMRMYGLQQQRKRSTANNTAKVESFVMNLTQVEADTPGHDQAEVDVEDAETKAARDAEFKGVYHQAYKAAMFTFVSHTREIDRMPDADGRDREIRLMRNCSRPTRSETWSIGY